MKNRAFAKRAGFALAGLKAAWREERSLRTQGYVALTLLPIMLWLQPSPVWWSLVGLLIVLVIAAELFNTALENLADRLHPELHPQIKLAKDCAAGAVLLISIGAVWVAAWMIIDTLNAL